MARKPTPSKPEPANLSTVQISTAIPKLNRRIDDLKALNIDSLNEDNHSNVVEDLERKIDDTLIQIFGNDTVDYNRYRTGTLDLTPLIMTFDGRGGTNIYERREHIKRGVARAVSKLESAVSILKERLEGSGETVGSRTINAYRGLDLHPEIARAASQLYQDGHYANAVEASVKALNGLVRLRSSHEADGTTLMERVFSPSNPILKFNDLADQSDKDEQKGFMMLFSGAVSGLRNPRAHKFVHDDPERALEFIAFVSLLAKLLDEATK